MKITLESEIRPEAVSEINRIIGIVKKNNTILGLKAEIECCFFTHIKAGSGSDHVWVKHLRSDERILIIE